MKLDLKVESICNRPVQYSPSNNRPEHEALGNKPHKLCIYSPELRMRSILLG